MASEVRELFKSECLLGEGAFFCEQSGRFLWVDILNSYIFCSEGDHFRRFSAGDLPSCVLRVEEDIVYFLDAKGLNTLNLKTSEVQLFAETPFFPEHKGLIRNNDGIYLGNGEYLYGSMMRSPQKDLGFVYHYNGIDTKLVYEGISIPNTFVPISKETILISDSMKQVVFSFQWNSSQRALKERTLWKDFSQTADTPDGACLSSEGHIYMALWDGARIAQLDFNGQELQSFPLKALRPTNCAWDRHGNRILVTTAAEGLSRSDLEQYSMSGSILEVSL